MQPHEIIRDYLLRELEEEDNKRQVNRAKVLEAVELEREDILAECEQEKEFVEYKIERLQDFWNETFNTYGLDVLAKMRPANVLGAIKEVEDNLERQLQYIILENFQGELEMVAQLQDMDYEEDRDNMMNANNYENHNDDNENNDGDQNQEDEDDEDRYEFGNNNNENEDATNEHPERNVENAKRSNKSAERYRTSEHNVISENYTEENEQERLSRSAKSSRSTHNVKNLQARSAEKREEQNVITTSPPPKAHFYPKYVTKREKMEMLMKNPAFVQTNQEINSPISEKKMEEFQFNRNKAAAMNFTFEPRSNIPEERGFKVTDEQPFIEDFDLEDAPRKLKVAMEAPDIDEVSYPEPWYGKSRIEEPKTRGFPLENLHDEKSFIKKNIDNYQTFEPEEPNFFARNVFSELPVKEGYEKDIILERLKQRYESAYRDNFLIDRAEMKHIENTKSRPVNLPEVPFLSEEQLLESKLLATLKSPVNVNDLKRLENPIASESFEEFKALRSANHHSSPTRQTETYKLSRNRSSGKSSPEKKKAPIFDQFEREIYEVTSAKLNSPYKGMNLGNSEALSASTYKSVFLQKSKSKYQDIGQLEDFIIDLYRTLSMNNGAVPPKHQQKLQELLNLKLPSNKYFEPRKSTVPKEGESDDVISENGTSRNSEVRLLNECLKNIAHEITNKTIDMLRPHPENKLRRLLWHSLMALQANFDETIELVNHHLVTKFDKIMQYTAQPGKVLLQLRSLPQKLRKEEFKKTLYDDFRGFFSELEEELTKAKPEDENEKLLLKYVYFAKRYIELLSQEDNLNMLYNNEQKITTNQKMNQRYLENAEKRKILQGEEGDSTSVNQNQEAYGIDFNKWEDNLKAIEQENKLLIKFNEEKKRKEEKTKKTDEKKKTKEEEKKIYEINQNRSRKEKEFKEQQKQEELKAKRDRIAEKVSLLRHVKQEAKQKDKEVQEENTKKTLEQIQFKNAQKMREKEEIKERQKERIQKLEEKKKLIASQKNVEHKSEKEEHVWRKAQELFEKQRRLLQEREKLNQHLKVMGK